MGLVILTNTASSLSGKIEAGFWVILLHGPHLLLGCPYYEPILWLMIIKVDVAGVVWHLVSQ